MQQSNGYIILFSALLTIVLGGLLSLAAVGLGPIQKKQVELDTKEKILGAVMTLEEGDDVIEIYNKRIESLVVDIDGNEVEKNEEGNPIIAEKVDIGSQYKKKPEERFFPVFKYRKNPGEEKVDAYIMPMYGNGLWDKIWGYIALGDNFTTIEGIVFDHKAETPGLGARITTDEIQSRYVGKKIYNEEDELISVTMRKGETGKPGQFGPHEVDGMSGATLTGVGLNNMLENYMSYYEAYFAKESKSLNM